MYAVAVAVAVGAGFSVHQCLRSHKFEIFRNPSDSDFNGKYLQGYLWFANKLHIIQWTMTTTLFIE